jgi:hypothetical protein
VSQTAGPNRFTVTAPGVPATVLFDDASDETITLQGSATFTIQGIAASGVTLNAPQNGAILGNFPRTTNLTWTAAPGSTAYDVDLAYCDGGSYNHESTTPDYGCTNWVSYPLVNTPNANYSFDFVGAQPGRWRVRPTYPGGAVGPWSAYSYFLYTI